MLSVNKIAADAIEASFEDIHKVFVHMQAVFEEAGNHEGAIRLQEQFLALCEEHEMDKKKPAVYSYVLNDLGESYFNTNKRATAQKFYQRNIKYNEALKRAGESTVGLLLDLQLAYGKLALCQVSVLPKGTPENELPPSIQKLLRLQQGLIPQILQRSDAKPSKKVLATVSAIATLLEMAHMFQERGFEYSSFSNFDMATSLCETYAELDKANDLQNSKNDSFKTSLADTKDNIALSRSASLARLGKHEEAERLLLRLLEEQQKRLGPNSANLIPTYNNLGFALSAKKQYAESEKYFLKGLDILMLQKENGEEWVEHLLNLQHHLATVLRAQHRLEEAGTLLERNLVLSTRAFGEESAQVTETLAFLGFLWNERREPSRSVDYLAQAHRNAPSSLPPNHPLTYRIGKEYANALVNASRPLEAEQVFLETKNVVYNTFGSHSIEAASCLHALGAIYDKLQQPFKAETSYLQALAVLDVLPSSRSKETLKAGCELSLGKLYTAQRKYSEAKSYLDQATRAFKANGNKTGLASSYAALGRFYFRNQQLKSALTSMEYALEIEQERGVPLDTHEAVSLQLEYIELLISSNNKQSAIQRLNALSNTVARSERINSSEKDNIRQQIDKQLAKTL